MGNEKLASLQQFGSGVSLDDGAFHGTDLAAPGSTLTCRGG